MSQEAPQPIPVAGPGGKEGGQGGPVDPRAAERLKRRVRIIENMKKIRHKIIVASGKGGVGKSTVATNLAAALAAQGNKVGLLDMDLTGPNLPTMLGVSGGGIQENEEGALVPVPVTDNLSVVSMQFLLPEPDQAVVWRGPIKMQVIGQFLGDVAWGEMDYLIVDLPPGSSDEPLSVAQNIPDADGIVIVTTPQEVAVTDVRKSVNFAKKLQLPVLGIIENMSGLTLHGQGPAGAELTFDTGDGSVDVDVDEDGHFAVTVDVFSRGGGKVLAEQAEVPFLGAVPLDLRVGRSGDAGTPLLGGDGSGPAFDAMQTIVGLLAEKLATEPAA